MRVCELVQYVSFTSLAALPWIALLWPGDHWPVLIYAALWWGLVGIWGAAWSRNINEDNR